MADDDEPLKSILLQRLEAERAEASARTQAWLSGLFEDIYNRQVDGTAAPPPKPIPESVRRLRTALAEPAAGALAELLAGTFMLATRSRGRPVYDEIGRGARVYQAVTDPAAESFIDDRYRAVTGAELFRMVAEDEKTDGLLVDDWKRCGSMGPIPRPNLLLSPGFCAAALDGRDIRAGAAPLPARSRAEVALWLDLHFFPSQRQAVEAPLPDGPVLLRFHAERPHPSLECDRDGRCPGQRDRHLEPGLRAFRPGCDAGAGRLRRWSKPDPVSRPAGRPQAAGRPARDA